MSAALARASPFVVARVFRFRRSTAPRVVRWPSTSNITMTRGRCCALREETVTPAADGEVKVDEVDGPPGVGWGAATRDGAGEQHGSEAAMPQPPSALVGCV